MILGTFFKKLTTQPEMIVFEEVIELIDGGYDFRPTAFSNGRISNEAGQNNGSCKILYFAKLHQLNDVQILHCFGRYYQDVLSNPAGESHQNIRAFMTTGMAGVMFEGVALIDKQV